MVVRAVIFDLDDTLVDTFALSAMRRARRWPDAVAALGLTTIFAGVNELVDRLTGASVQWAVVTTSVSFYADRVLAHHGLSPGARIAFHDAPPKPDGAPVLAALGRLGVPAEQAVGVGDSSIDIDAYRRAGVLSVRAGWCPRSHDGAWNHEVGTPKECAALIFGL